MLEIKPSILSVTVAPASTYSLPASIVIGSSVPFNLIVAGVLSKNTLFPLDGFVSSVILFPNKSTKSEILNVISPSTKAVSSGIS